jgi:hypothetical protein
MGDEEKKARYWELYAAADAAWKAGDMAEWERLTPLAAEALAESGLEVHCAHPLLFRMRVETPGHRPEDN